MPPRTAATLAALAALPGCCWIAGYRSPEGVEWGQDLSKPELPLHRKAELYQRRLESEFQTREGLLRYRRDARRAGDASYGDLADGCFHTGIYLASQSLRLAVTGEPAARAQALKTLDALRLLMEVTGKRGLLARHFSPAGTRSGENWRDSTALPDYVWRGDVSKDQYAGFIFGLGVALAAAGGDAELRSRIGALAGAAADHIIENDLAIIDVDGRRTTYGDLDGHWGFVPIGVNAAIALAIAKVAAESTGEGRYKDFYQDLVEKRDYHRVTRWVRPPWFDTGRRVNEHMWYLAIYPLLLLEKDPRIRGVYRDAEAPLWDDFREERNAFFAYVHVAAAAGGPGGPAAADGGAQGREALGEFPLEKVEWPVDLIRAGYKLPRSFLHTSDCLPLTTRGVPLHLRPRSSSMWVSNPYRLAGNLSRRGQTETAGVDYLAAYWMGRWQGLLGADD
jgi:hypothetical protein